MADCIIDISKQDQYGKEEFVRDLKKLRELIFDLGGAAKDLDLRACDFCNDLFVLNWLINSVEYIDSYDS